MPFIAEATSDIAIVRLHGRNREAWEKKGIPVAELFNYLYTEQELEELTPRVKQLASNTKQLHVLFNNCYGDKAVENARQMRLMLGQSAPATQETLLGLESTLESPE